MSDGVINELNERADFLEAKARALPEGEAREQVLEAIAGLRARLGLLDREPENGKWSVG